MSDDLPPDANGWCLPPPRPAPRATPPRVLVALGVMVAPDFLRAIDARAAAWGVSRTEAVRRLLHEALSRAAEVA